MKNTTHRFRNVALACLFGLSGAVSAAPFSSGSTGADGAFSPTQDTTLALPPSGIFNFTTVSIPSGVRVRFQNSGTNTPVTILATGDVVIEGVVDVRGGDADHMRAALGSFLQQGGLGGPGGYSGGRGGDVGAQPGATGQGPGGGGGGGGMCPGSAQSDPVGGGGGGFASAGEHSRCLRSYAGVKGGGGAAYGSSIMLPLVGGSGGGGGAGAYKATGIPGAGGGGGGGALLIASSGAVRVTGSILAQGGSGGGYGGTTNCLGWIAGSHGGIGGGGSGGIVRILAQSYQGGGTINVAGGLQGCPIGDNWKNGGNGSQGFVSVETPRAGTLSLNGLPSLAVTQIGGQVVPPNPTGSGDIALPLTQANPVQIDVAARYIPPGTAIKVVLTPSYSGDVVSVNATPLAGTLENSTASASINIPYGASTILVQASYTLTLAMGESLSKYAQGERVESVLMSAAPGGETQFKLVTVSGKQFDIAPAVLAMVMPS